MQNSSAGTAAGKELQRDLIYRQTRWLTSAPAIGTLSSDSGKEIAIVGRSNSGKSSAINAICDHRGLARTSNTPGRTRQINLFAVDDSHRIVDLPGYGYAAVSATVKKQWQNSLSEYLSQRQSLCGLIITMDIRVAMTALDRQLLDWSVQSAINVFILLTKADKISQSQRTDKVRQVRQALSEYSASFNVVAFSSTKKIGLNAVRSWLTERLFGS